MAFWKSTSSLQQYWIKYYATLTELEVKVSLEQFIMVLWKTVFVCLMANFALF